MASLNNINQAYSLQDAIPSSSLISDTWCLLEHRKGRRLGLRLQWDQGLGWGTLPNTSKLVPFSLFDFFFHQFPGFCYDQPDSGGEVSDRLERNRI